MPKTLLKKKAKVKRPPTPDMKGLQCVMGSVFLLIMRLLLTEGLASSMLLLASLFLAAGFIRWRKRTPLWGAGIAGAAVMLAGAAAEFWGYTAGNSSGVLALHTIMTVLVTAGAILSMLIAANTAAHICREERDEKTEGILLQRRWWIGIGYALCGGWTVFDLLTGLYPNIGLVMRLAAIIINVFFLSALFQVRGLIE